CSLTTVICKNNMSGKRILWNYFDRLESFVHRKSLHTNTKGQAVVEFTLIFVLLLVIAWIPADFGLAFFTGQLAQNASREGARLAAATKPFNTADIQTQVSNRIRSALLTNTSINVTSPTCDPTLGMQVVSVTVSGDYNFYLY